METRKPIALRYQTEERHLVRVQTYLQAYEISKQIGKKLAGMVLHDDFLRDYVRNRSKKTREDERYCQRLYPTVQRELLVLPAGGKFVKGVDFVDRHEECRRVTDPAFYDNENLRKAGETKPRRPMHKDGIIVIPASDIPKEAI